MDVRIDGVRYVPVHHWPSLPDRMGEMLVEARRTSGITLDEAAERIGISKTYLWELESSKATDPSFRLMVRIARHYGLGLNTLAAAHDFTD